MQVFLELNAQPVYYCAANAYKLHRKEKISNWSTRTFQKCIRLFISNALHTHLKRMFEQNCLLKNSVANWNYSTMYQHGERALHKVHHKLNRNFPQINRKSITLLYTKFLKCKLCFECKSVAISPVQLLRVDFWYISKLQLVKLLCKLTHAGS